VNSPLQPLDHRLLKHRRGALTLAAALAAFVPLCWIVIQLRGSFPGDSDFISRMRHPHPGEPLALFAHIFAALGNPIVAALCVAIVWVLIDDDLGPLRRARPRATLGGGTQADGRPPVTSARLRSHGDL
jgi:hypothetical protein